MPIVRTTRIAMDLGDNEINPESHWPGQSCGAVYGLLPHVLAG
jgi:hypothetical protein